MFIHDDKDAVIIILLVFISIYLYTLPYFIFACTNFNLVLVFSLPTTHLLMMTNMQHMHIFKGARDKTLATATSKSK